MKTFFFGEPEIGRITFSGWRPKLLFQAAGSSHHVAIPGFHPDPNSQDPTHEGPARLLHMYLDHVVHRRVYTPKCARSCTRWACIARAKVLLPALGAEALGSVGAERR